MVDTATSPPIMEDGALPHDFFEDLKQYMPVLDHYHDNEVAFGADFVDNTLLPIDRFKMGVQVKDLPVPDMRYATKGTALPIYVNHITSS